MSVNISEIPSTVHDTEPLHRRIHPTFRKPDGSISSQAFTDPEMSVDRGLYRSSAESLDGHAGFGLASLLASNARENGQIVESDKGLENPAHALVRGKKTKSIAKQLARLSQWVVAVS